MALYGTGATVVVRHGDGTTISTNGTVTSTTAPRPLPESTDFPKLTVSARWLEKFARDNEAQLRGKTTWDVSEMLLKPFTLAAKTAYVELLREAGEKLDDGSPAVGDAVCFVSHAWGGDFLDMCACVTTWAKKEQPAAFVWLDVFAVNQHQGEMPSEWWDTTFRNAVGELANTLLVLTPWEKPVAITRVWCLWEILCTIDQGGDLTILMPKEQKPRLADALREDLDGVQSKVAEVDAEHADATMEADKKRIFEAVKRQLPRGFVDLNGKVKDRLRAWTRDAALGALQEMPEEDRATSDLITKLGEYCRKQSEYPQAEKLYTEAIAGRRAKLGNDNPETLTAIAGLGYMLEYQERFAEAEPVLVEALEGRRRVLPTDHADTLQSMNDLGNLYLNLKDFQAAEALYQESRLGRERTLDPTEYDMLQSYNNLGRLYQKTARYDDAFEMVEKALEGRKATLGTNHPTTLYTMTTLAKFRSEVGDLEGAAALYTEALGLQQKVLGDGHEHTNSTKLNLARVLDTSVNSPRPLPRAREKSVELLKEAHAGFAKLGGHDKDTKDASVLLDRTSLDLEARELRRSLQDEHEIDEEAKADAKLQKQGGVDAA